jgi:hypothetical protein
MPGARETARSIRRNTCAGMKRQADPDFERGLARTAVVARASTLQGSGSNR